MIEILAQKQQLSTGHCTPRQLPLLSLSVKNRVLMEQFHSRLQLLRKMCHFRDWSFVSQGKLAFVVLVALCIRQMHVCLYLHIYIIHTWYTYIYLRIYIYMYNVNTTCCFVYIICLITFQNISQQDIFHYFIRIISEIFILIILE